MIENIIVGKTYFRGNANSPFYTSEICDAVNRDGTIDKNGIGRYTTTSSTLSHWCLTKEEAQKDMVDWYMMAFYDKVISDKHESYQKFCRDILPFVEKKYPEYLI